MKVGSTGAEALQLAVSSRSDLISTPLPYLIPYLKASDKQAYICKRASDLSEDVCMKQYIWNGGGSEQIEKSDEGGLHFASIITFTAIINRSGS